MMQKPNPMDYPMTIDGALQYQTDLQNWQAGLRNRLKANMAPDTIQVSPAEYEALRRDAERLDFLDTLTKRTHKVGRKFWPISSDMHFGALGVSLYVRTGIGSGIETQGNGATVRAAIDAAINMPANGEGA
jgi:hypothetical protein